LSNVVDNPCLALSSFFGCLEMTTQDD
jgi:hypothetical protein